MNPVTLHISLTPRDWRHAEHVLPHQLRTWAGQVADVQLTVDLVPSRGERFGGGTAQDVVQLRRVLEHATDGRPHVRIVEVDGSAATLAAVAERFFGGGRVPGKSHYGAAYYAYFFGWHTSRQDTVLHLDSDMLFGGASPTWVAEGLALLAQRPDVLLCSPLPGPPTVDGELPPHVVAAHDSDGSRFHREPVPGLAYGMQSCSTRVLMMDRRTLAERLGPLRPRPPYWRSHLRARVQGHEPVELPEATLSRRMRETGQQRIDFLGSGAGMWSLHPPLRSPEFYAALPELVRRVELGDMPPEQLGDFDVNDSLVDWSSARAADPGRVRRLLHDVRQRARR